MKKTPVKLSAEQTQIINECKKAFANIWSHPKGARGGKEFQEGEQCEYCGKKTGEGKNTRYVHILTSGLILPNGLDGDKINELSCITDKQDQSQGCFALGSECAKKLLGKRIDEFSFYYK
jgi:hypothetical protein